MDKRCQHKHICGSCNLAIQQAVGGTNPHTDSNKLRRLLRISERPAHSVTAMSLYHEIQAISHTA